MRISRFSADGEDRIGLFEQDQVIDVSRGYDSFTDALSLSRNLLRNTTETHSVWRR